MAELSKLNSFYKRMKKAGILVEMAGNYPWIYLDRVNNKRVTEKFHADHGFTIGFLPIQPDKEFEFIDIGELFKIIRKYSIPTRQVIIEKTTK